MQKQRKSHLDRQISQYGNDFLDRQTPQQIKNFHVPKILLDMAYGNVDYEKYSDILSNPTLLQLMLDVTSTKSTFYAISDTATGMLLEQLQQIPNSDPHYYNNVMSVKEVHHGVHMYYAILYDALLKYYSSGTISYLYPLKGELKGYVKYIS